MKKAIIFALFTALAIAQISGPKWIYGYVGNKAQWLSIGPSLMVSTSGQLDVAPVVAQSAQKARVYDALLIYDAASKTWSVPAGATNVVIHVNGLRYRAGTDYTIAAGKLSATNGAIFPEWQVTADYDL